MAAHERETIRLDGMVANGDTFTHCHFVYAGGKPPSIVNCNFRDCTFAFEGPAQNTLLVLSSLYKGGFKDLIEGTITNIRGGKAGN